MYVPKSAVAIFSAACARSEALLPARRMAAASASRT
jgi:hypothetical protein